MRQAPCPRPILHQRLRSLAAVRLRIDSLLEDSRRLEHHDPARRDRHFLAGLGIAADALAFLAHHERAERRQLHCFATFEAVRDFFEYKFYECRGFGARQAHLLVDRLTQIRTRDCLSRHRQPRARRSIQRRSTYRAELSTILAWRRRCQPGFSRTAKVYQRTSAAPQVKPPPMASSSRRSPRLMRRSATASASASGIEAAEVLPWRSTVTTILPGGMPSLWAEPSIMRLLAWCGMNQSTSAAV